MISSGTPKALLAVVLVVSVTAKVLPAATAKQTASGGMATVAALFSDQGFEIAKVSEGGAGLQFVQAARASCKLLVASLAFGGEHRDPIRRMASQDDRVFFVFRGETYPHQPIWRTRFARYWTGLREQAGLKVAFSPLFGVIASPACELDQIRWEAFPGPVGR